jgi:hypothetical protein
MYFYLPQYLKEHYQMEQRFGFQRKEYIENLQCHFRMYFEFQSLYPLNFFKTSIYFRIELSHNWQLLGSNRL